MKNVFKMMCIALAACTMFVSCGEKENTYTITVSVNDEAMGTVTGGGTYDSAAIATLTATPNNGYVFVSWSDGNTENPRQIVVTEDLTLVATFAAAEGVNVRFGSQSWDANDQGSSYQYLSSYDAIGIGASSAADGQTYPLADVYYYAQQPGSYSDQYNGEGYANSIIAYVEYYENTYLTDQNGSKYGDWWAKTAVFTVNAFDATALNLSMVCDATMFDAVTALVDGAGYDAAPTQNMVVTANVELTSAKNATLKKGWNK